MKDDRNYLRISGVLSPAGDLELRPSYLTANDRGSWNVEDSPLQLELYRGDELRLRWGASLLTHSHATGSRAERGGADFFAVRAKPPVPAGVDRIVFRYRDVEVGEIRRPDSEPEIGAVDASSGKGSVRITWEASHPENCELEYYLRASSDGGRNWTRLGSRLHTTELEVAGERIVGDPCIIEVVAYDGFNTVTARTDVHGVAPRLEAAIVEPEADEVQAGRTVTLRAETISNLPLGIIDDFEWKVDGELLPSTGSAASWTPPEPCVATVEVKVRQAELEAVASREIRVIGPEDYSPPTAQ